MVRRGFTVVELIITITVMGILLLLTIVNVNATQVNARDDERKADIASIQNYLENFYTTGSPLDNTLVNVYPTTALASSANLLANLPDADLEAFKAPGATDAYASFLAATNQYPQTYNIQPSPTVSTYIYQPLRSNNSLCTAAYANDCRRYNLFYRLEGDSTTYVVSSKYQ